MVQCQVYLRCDRGTHARAAFARRGRHVLPAGQVRDQTSQSNDRVRVGISSLARNLLSGNVIHRPLRIPLSSFIVEDMMEYVHAHATYKFILHDDEEERPRILVCCRSAPAYR